MIYLSILCMYINDIFIHCITLTKTVTVINCKAHAKRIRREVRLWSISKERYVQSWASKTVVPFEWGYKARELQRKPINEASWPQHGPEGWGTEGRGVWATSGDNDRRSFTGACWRHISPFYGRLQSFDWRKRASVSVAPMIPCHKYSKWRYW